MYNQPQRAKRLYFDVIPRAVDEYIANADKRPHPDRGRTADQPGLAHPRRPPAEPRRQPDLLRHAAEPRQRGERRHAGHPVGLHPPLQPGRHARDAAVAGPAGRPRHRLLPATSSARRSASASPTPIERAALEDLAATLAALPADADAETIQNAVYEVGKRHPFAELRAWFGCLYQVLLGQQEGPRFGGFVALYGIPETIALIRRRAHSPGGCRLTHAGVRAISRTTMQDAGCATCPPCSAWRC